MNRIIPSLVILALIISCKATDQKSSSLPPMNDSSVNLFAFVGEKISVTEFDPNENNETISIDSITGDTIRKVKLVMDAGFNCRYKVLKNVFNQLGTDTIEFRAYDHYGRPPFENYDKVLLYISLSSDSSHYYQQKYQFDVVQQSKNGSWKGTKGQSLESLFNEKRKGVLQSREVFKD